MTKPQYACTICTQLGGSIVRYSYNRQRYKTIAGYNHPECERAQSEARARIRKAKQGEMWAKAGQQAFDLSIEASDAGRQALADLMSPNEPS